MRGLGSQRLACVTGRQALTHAVVSRGRGGPLPSTREQELTGGLCDLSCLCAAVFMKGAWWNIGEYKARAFSHRLLHAALHRSDTYSHSQG